jgi:hypothetical protein
MILDLIKDSETKAASVLASIYTGVSKLTKLQEAIADHASELADLQSEYEKTLADFHDLFLQFADIKKSVSSIIPGASTNDKG